MANTKHINLVVLKIDIVTLFIYSYHGIFNTYIFKYINKVFLILKC